MSGLLVRKKSEDIVPERCDFGIAQPGLFVHAELRLGEFGEHFIELLQGGDGIWHKVRRH